MEFHIHILGKNLLTVGLKLSISISQKFSIWKSLPKNEIKTNLITISIFYLFNFSENLNISPATKI